MGPFEVLCRYFQVGGNLTSPHAGCLHLQSTMGVKKSRVISPLQLSNHHLEDLLCIELLLKQSVGVCVTRKLFFFFGEPMKDWMSDGCLSFIFHHNDSFSH